MAAIVWKDSWSVEVQSIDDQHKKLIDLINNFYDNIKSKSNDELILELVKGMKDYTLMHFSYEEEHMQKFKCPNYDTHKKEHEEFISKIKDIEEKLKNGNLVLSFEITNFLKKWISNHIQSIDKTYTGCFVKNGMR